MSLDFYAYLSVPGERLKSVNNEVARVATPCGTVIRKRYRSTESYQHEMAQLQALHAHGLPVPRILFHQPNIVFLEDFGDTTYVDVLDMFYEECALEMPMHALLDFLFNYYDAAKTLRGDVNLRNFLYKDGVCYGVDFEDPQSTGRPEMDLGRMLAFVLTYAPAFDPRRIAAAHVLWKHCLFKGLDPALLWQHMQKEFCAMNARRQGFRPLFEQALAFAPRWEELDA